MVHLFKKSLIALGCFAWMTGVEPIQGRAQIPVTDDEWNSLSTNLIQDIERGYPVAEKLFEILPQMRKILKTDSQRTFMKSLWGTSLNRDEHARAEIVNPKVILKLSEEVGVPLPDGDRVFAGIEHTYGYLFSILNTSFGHKRLRWIQGELENGLGLSKGTLGPFPQEGTLFGNVTYFFGRIAFRTDDAVLSQLMTLREGLSKDLIQYSYEDLTPIRVIEEVTLSESRQVQLRTDLVPFLKQPTTGGATYLLIYSVEDSQNSASQLITGFPIEDRMVKSLTAPKTLGERVLITTRYNAFVRGLSGKSVMGKRTLVKQ